MLEGFVRIPIFNKSSFLSVTENGLNFNGTVVFHMEKTNYINLLFNADKKQIAIIKCDKNSDDKVPFYRDEKNLKNGVRFNNREIQQMISRIMEWDLSKFNYRVDGYFISEEQAMIFDLQNARKFQKKNKKQTNTWQKQYWRLN